MSTCYLLETMEELVNKIKEYEEIGYTITMEKELANDTNFYYALYVDDEERTLEYWCMKIL